MPDLSDIDIYNRGIKKGDLDFSMVCSGVLMVPSGFCLFLKVSGFLTPYALFLGTFSVCGSKVVAGSPMSTIYSHQDSVSEPVKKSELYVLISLAIRGVIKRVHAKYFM